ncbi:hypothetical protein VRK_24730 [Vibrio sp. MEBiC08052]|nr:hypothetical protein VRK_24730 [Vibrio sp. MEBiC08052]
MLSEVGIFFYKKIKKYHFVRFFNFWVAGFIDFLLGFIFNKTINKALLRGWMSTIQTV